MNHPFKDRRLQDPCVPPKQMLFKLVVWSLRTDKQLSSKGSSACSVSRNSLALGGWACYRRGIKRLITYSSPAERCSIVNKPISPDTKKNCALALIALILVIGSAYAIQHGAMQDISEAMYHRLRNGRF